MKTEILITKVELMSQELRCLEAIISGTPKWLILPVAWWDSQYAKVNLGIFGKEWPHPGEHVIWWWDDRWKEVLTTQRSKWVRICRQTAWHCAWGHPGMMASCVTGGMTSWNIDISGKEMGRFCGSCTWRFPFLSLLKGVATVITLIWRW